MLVRWVWLGVLKAAGAGINLDLNDNPNTCSKSRHINVSKYNVEVFNACSGRAVKVDSAFSN
jgi:hypothetical protein